MIVNNILVYLVIIAILFRLSESETFNFEIGARVKDNIALYLNKVSAAGVLPLVILKTGNVRNFFYYQKLE